LEQICGLRSASATVGADRHRIGAYALDVDVDRSDRVQPGNQIRRTGRHKAAKRRQVGAKVGEDEHPKPEKAAVLVKREFSPGEVVAPLVVGDECFGATLLPLHWPFELTACPDHQSVLGIYERLHAKAAADIGRDQAEHVLRYLEDGLGERVTHEMPTP